MVAQSVETVGLGRREFGHRLKLVEPRLGLREFGQLLAGTGLVELAAAQLD